MVFSRYCNPLCDSTILSNPTETAFEYVSVVGPLPASKQVFSIGPPPAAEPDFVPGFTLMDFVFIRLLVSDTSISPAPRSLLLVAASSPVIYSQTKLQQLLRICMSANKFSDNELRSILKTCFLNVYFGNFYFNCY